MSSSIATAIAALASEINASLLAGRSTRELRAELATLEQRQRREDAERAAAAATADAERQRVEAEKLDAYAAALATAIEGGLRARLTALAPPPPVIRRTPAGIHVVTEESEQ